MKLLISIIFFLFLGPELLRAQVCSGSLGDPILNETFGTGSNKLPPYKTNYIFQGGCPSKGNYTLSDFLFGCGNRTWVQMIGDHTPNDSKGNYMLVNAENTPGTVYMDTVKGLCGNTVYQFGMWVTSVMSGFACSGNAILPNLKFQIKTLTGITLASDSTGFLPIVVEREWKYFGLSLKTPAGNSDVIISITINPPFGCGSAFALDDITLSPCGPTISALIDGSPGPAEVCADYTNPFVMNATYSAGLTDPALQWQSSVDSGKTWIDIAGETTLTYAVPYRITGVILYRICIAEKTNINSLKCRIVSNPVYTSIHPVPEHKAPQNMQGCLFKNFLFPETDPRAFQVLWTGPGGYSSNLAASTIPAIQYKDTGLYKLKETFDYGCVSLDTFYLKVFPGTSVSVTPGYPVCEGKTENLTASSPDLVSYQWTPSAYLSSAIIANPIASPLDSTKYKVVVTNAFGCKDSAYVQVNVYRNPYANAGPDKSIILGDTATLNAFFKGTSVNFSWSPASFLDDKYSINPKAYPTVDTKYTLNVTSAVGCGVATDDVLVKVFKDIFIPNAFTPNGDGKNDMFQISAFGNYKLLRLFIYNRNGQLVFKAIDTFNGWDGTFKGMPQASGVFVYYLELKSPIGKKISRRGTVLLIR